MDLANPGPWGLVIVGVVVGFAAWVQAEKIPVLGEIDWDTQRVRALAAAAGLVVAGVGWAVAGGVRANSAESDAAIPEETTTTTNPPAAAAVTSGIAVAGDLTVEGDINTGGSAEDSESAGGLTGGLEDDARLIRNLRIGSSEETTVVTALLVNNSSVPITVDRLVLAEHVVAGYPDDLGGCGGPSAYDIWLEPRNATILWSSDEAVVAEVEELSTDDPDVSFAATVYYTSGTCTSDGYVEVQPPIIVTPGDGVSLAINVPVEFTISTSADVISEPGGDFVEERTETQGVAFDVLSFDPENTPDDVVVEDWVVTLTAFAEGNCYAAGLDLKDGGQRQISELMEAQFPHGGVSYRDVLCEFKAPSEP